MSGHEISVARILELCRERDVRLAYEIGAFVVFEACEAVLTQPRSAGPERVWVSGEGATRVASSEATPEDAAVRSLADLLAAVLVAAGQELPPMMMHLVDAGRASALGLAGYRDELEAALVPLNRAAARRVLARQLRELTKPAGARGADEMAAAHEVHDADAALDALLGYEGPKAPLPARAELGTPGTRDDVGDARAPDTRHAEGLPFGTAPPPPLAIPLAGAPLRGADLHGVHEEPVAAPRGAMWALALLVTLVASGGAYLWLTGQP